MISRKYSNPETSSSKKEKGFRSVNNRIVYYTFISLAVLFSLMIIAASIGSARIPLKQTFELIIDGIPVLRNLVNVSDISPTYKTIIQNVRLPRVFLAVLVGMSLSSSGVMYQGLFRNPMADPYIIGVSSGASLSASIAILMGLTSGIGSISGIVLSAFAGALLTTFLVFNLARSKKGHLNVLTLILSGIAIGALLNAATSFVMLVSSKEKLQAVVFWMMGSLTSALWVKVKVVGPIIIVGIISLFFYTKDLNSITLGESRAKQLGINVELMKNMIIIISSFIVAAAVSVTGIIGFVGLVVPHMMRLIVGPDNRILLPVSAVSGGIVLLLADTIARNILEPSEIPVGIITALIGAPFFIYLLKKTKTGY
ncbi:MAG TPA: iron chelate uptake ABC transporter family permease subunit [Actinobacteria bacterium]|nr:iron chelate uptake ABC transporter family permease subunit [Actinomycetota bacterium]